MEVELHDDSVDCTNGDYFCELCSLNFSTHNELEEHTWSMLHNTNLNRKKGRNCVHSCSLCKQEFVGLLEFTGHLHSECHQEKLHKWRKDQHQEWSPDKQQQNSPKPDSPDQEKPNKPPSDWSADDFTGFVDYFSDHTGEAPMGDTWQGRGPPRDPRDIPSLLDCPPQFGYRCQEQFDRRRDRRDQFQGRRYPPWNEENRDWPREFRDSPPLNPEYPDMNYAGQENDQYHWMRNSDEWQNERYYENRDEDLYSSRMYPGDGQRPSYDGNEEYRSRRGNQTYLHGNRNMRRRSNSPHRHRKQIKSVAGSVVPSRRQKDRRPSSRSSRAEGCSDSKQKEVHKQAEGKERPSETKRKEDRAAPKSSPSLGSPRKEDKTPSKSSPSSGSPGAKSTRKGNPRKLLRPAEEKKDEVASTGSGNSSVKGATQDKESERLVKTKHNKLEITITGKNDKGESSSVSQPVVEDKKSKSPTKSSSTTAVIAGTSLTKMPNFLGDSSATATKDSSTTTKEDSSTTVKKDSSIAVTKDSTSILKEEPKGDYSSSVKGNLLPTLDTSKGSLTAVQGKEHPLKVLNEQKASLLSLKDKENSGSQSKGNKETIISFPDKENPTKKESSLAFLQEKNDPSRNSTMDTLPVFEKDKDQQSFKLGGVSLLSTGEKRLASDAKDQTESSVTTDKLFMPSVTRDNIHVARNSSSLPPVDEKEKMFGLRVSNGGQKNINPTVSSATISTISSLPWKEREEKLRSLLGIKKEPKDSESPQDSTPCAVSKSNEVSTESEAHHPVVSSSTSVTALSSSSIKSASSRYVPGFSQLSLSRPQCSFVHIDGVQCGAVTWNKYCSYHQRVFGSEENNSQDQSLASKSSHLTRDETREIESSRRPLFSRTGGAQIFRPTTPPHKPPERPDTHAGLDMKTGLGDSEDIEKEQKQLSGSSKGAVGSSEGIDLNSTSPYKPLGSTVNATRGNIDLSTTFKGASRNLVFRGSSAGFNSDHSIGAETGSIIGANVITSTRSSNGAKIGASTGANIDLSDTVRRLGGTLAQQGTNLDSDNSPGIDLSGTVPNLEGLLALHGSSAIDRKTGPKIDLSKTVLKHGPSWGHQGSSGDSTSNIDLAATVSNRGSSVSTESGPSIDLNETIPQPRRSRTPQDSISRKESQASNLNQHAAPDSVTSHLKGDALYPQMHLVKTEPGQEEASSVQHTEMIDLNFSTKLLGVPHSVVAPFNASMHSSQKSPREMTKSPSEFSTQSSARSSPRSYAPSSPQSPLVSRRVSTTSPAPVDQRPGSTISLPSLSLDLSRFNLPPAVRKALAERYSGKKVTAATGSHPADSSEGRRSQPPFSEHKPEGPFDLGKKASPLPARLRGRGQRSVSLDSPIAQRGNIFETQQFFNRQVVKDGQHHSGLHVSSSNTATGTRSSYDPSFGVHVPSTKVPPFSVPLRNVPHHPGVPSQENSTELQSRGLIDLSSTSYLERMSAPSVNEGRPADACRFSIDNLRSPPKPSALQSRGLIDLNTTTEYGVRDTVLESPEGLSAIKRKRLDSSEGTESVSSLVAEKVVKRPKQGETLSREDKEVTYRPGINVQELLTIEREEQNQLQNLHAVQSRLKSVRAQIQKLCTELDSLSSEEQRITLRMGELRNMRLSILENACYERQGLPLPFRNETASTQETSKLTTLDNRDDSMTSTVLSESSASVDKGDPFESVHTKTDGHLVCSSQDKTPRTNVKDPWSNNREDNKETEQIATEAKIDGDSTVCSSAESPLSTSSSSDVPQTGTQVSPVGTATKFVLREEMLPTEDPRDKVEESINVASKRATKRSQSYNGAEINRGAKAPVQTYATRIGETVKTRDRTVDIPRTQQGGVPSSLDASSEQTAGSSPGNLDDQIRKYLVKKTKHSHRSEKALFRKKSFSDVNVSKTIEASRKKIQSVKENMKRWKQQEQRFDVRGSHDEQTEKNSSNCASSSSMDGAETSAENPGKEKSVSSPKIALQDKPSPRKTTKELKKSSLFHSGKKRSRESRRNKPEKSQARDKECKERAVVTSKRRKIDDTSPSTQRSAPTKEKTSSKGKGQVVSAAAHTTTAELGGSATEERSSTEDEIPTRDVDSQSYEARSGPSRSSHIQIPSSTSQNSKGNKKHRGPPACKFVGHTGAVCGLKVHDGHLFTCSADKTTRAFDIQSGECVKIYRGHTQAVNCVEVSEDRVRLFTGSNDQTVRSYNIKSGVCTHKFTFDGRVMCLHAAFDLLFVGLNTGIVASIDLVKNKCIERLHCHEPRGVSCLTTATEGQRKLLCCGSFDSTVTIRDYKTGLLIRTFSDHNMTVLCLQVVDNILYSGSADMKVQAHNLNTGELVRSFDGHTRSVSGLQVVGRVLVTSCLDKLIRCYDLMTGELLQVYGGQMDMIFSVLVSNGKIYSGGRDGSVVASKLDLRVYHPCKWENCNLNFGIVSHLKNHIQEYHVMEQGTVEACHWTQCGHQFSTDDDIAAVLKHVLGHVVKRTARKSSS